MLILYTSVKFATGIRRVNCLTFFWYDFSGIIGGSELRRMCLHSLRSPCDFFWQQNGTVLTETLRRSYGTARSLCSPHVIFMTSTQKSHNAHAMSLQVPYNYLKCLRYFPPKRIYKILQCPHDQRAMPVRGSCNLPVMCLRACHLSKLVKVRS